MISLLGLASVTTRVFYSACSTLKMEIIYSPKLELTYKGMHDFISQFLLFFSVRRIHVQPEWEINYKKYE
jgi:hypothetical protein